MNRSTSSPFSPCAPKTAASAAAPLPAFSGPAHQRPGRQQLAGFLAAGSYGGMAGGRAAVLPGDLERRLRVGRSRNGRSRNPEPLARLSRNYAIEAARTILAGHSLGGEIAIWLALRAQLRRAVSLAIGPGGHTWTTG